MSDPVQDLLIKNGLKFRPSGRDYLIECLNPEHNDSDPSLRVDRVTGVMHCFSCGFKHNLFKFYGVFTNITSIKVAQLKIKLGNIKANLNGLEMPEGATPFGMKYRGISVQTFRDFGAFTTYRVEKLQDRLVFPIKDVRDKTSVFVARHTLSSANPKYLYYPEGVELPIYPVKYSGGPYQTAVLVEGMFDMLNLYDKGLKNATCCFGTNTLTKDLALKLLPLKAQGIVKLYILFDGDEAGRKAAKHLKPLIEAEQFIVEIIDLPDGMDPGGLDQEYVDSIKEYINT